MLLLLLSCFSRVRLCAAPWTAAYQAPPSMGFSRQEYWSGLPLPSPNTTQWDSSKLTEGELLGSLRQNSPKPPGSQQSHAKGVLSGYTWWVSQFSSVQSSQSCPTLCDPMNRSTPGLPVHHHLPEFPKILRFIHMPGDSLYHHLRRLLRT